jgi:hypothetical protein
MASSSDEREKMNQEVVRSPLLILCMLYFLWTSEKAELCEQSSKSGHATGLGVEG